VFHYSHQTPPPRFADIYLVGIVLTAYLFSWVPALMLYVWSLLVCLWVLPPPGSFLVATPTDMYRVISYSVCSLAVIAIIRRLQSAPAGNTEAPGPGGDREPRSA
jgi:Domain of unknown function (DUF4118)